MVVEKFVDSVLFVKPDLTIFSGNPATSRVLGISQEEIIGKSLKEVLKIAQNSKDSSEGILDLFDSLEEAIQAHGSLKISKNVEIQLPDGTTTFLNIGINGIGKNNVIQSVNQSCCLKYLTVVCRDISHIVRAKKLLKEERARSDSLLRQILPPIIVDSLQKGENDVYISVQSATIVFMDIVEFTPWCAANTAQMIMSTLNRLFKEFDCILSQFHTMTKIKCIGDCYMAAGGIFDDPNVPSIHATEVVEFGCKSIKVVKMVDQELGLDRRIRVGVNTGGPIVAGVLGVDRPTFEILGPAINMAQQMEHHGIPMMVHISRPVYELIYGEHFEIKERGEVEVKGGKVLTYIVNPDSIE